MWKKILLFGMLIFLAACSSQNLSLEDLKTAYPDTFAQPVEELSSEKQEKLGLPEDMPFEVTKVESKVEDQRVQVLYQSSGKEKTEVRTLFAPGNVLEESELQIPLNTGAVAGVQEKKDHIFVEWYDGDLDVIYQIQYYGPKEGRTEKALEVANAI
ncbi:hypothetical protein SAMN05192559_105315 [Halobacillus karajensis]|uniref:DUF4367 domain-containing protein n=1 Tax=Halobacillus karajensis TaxID=195088 RepID=A0A024P4Z3_9BACI|nr:hypothetical protein [Halobacillus karajensis]CDQ20422.1 hypothetical protein BN982_02763 [Halobacillus karajensis]CDQ24109.1 hypothetical protein BN983_02374 [Halobacillus karajensis]CDQ27587.1 hypothetical protein BN981_01855 [Halobacillus karajensis]SEH91892.1 hypothetical protein SAMN05192559_105315 [Halobacillus karajensis]